MDNTEEKQISTSDSDSRALIINKNIVEVSYNSQSAVDAKTASCRFAGQRKYEFEKRRCY
ncbi:MAG TPA: hypothetical protein VJ765_10550 [Chitinophagaceae bacterium]|nr:hypothetical protein [Chitinophagaceae bacterium]